MADMTIYTLAKELNMTPSMVSRAFNPDGKISEEKRRIVLDAAKRYDFHPNRFASRLSMKPIRIGVLLRSRFRVAVDKMLEGIARSHEQLKDYKIEYDVSVFDATSTDEDIWLALERYREYDGILLSGMSSSRYTEGINELYRKNKNIVQVQSVNKDACSLFSSKHDETVASGLAADFLEQCLRYSERKNILLFTGDLTSAVHAGAVKAFTACCEEKGMTLLDVVDMKDNEGYFASLLPEIFSTHQDHLDGIYITSGVSAPLCRYLEELGVRVPFVAFDTHAEVKRYMEKGVVSAAISQNVAHQMQVAFELLVKHIMVNGECPPVVYTDVNLMLKSNMSQFD